MRSIVVTAVAALIGYGGLAGPAAAHDQGQRHFTFDRMNYFDVDGDGFASRDELKLAAPEYSGYVFIYADLDNDGLLNRRELYRAERRVRQNESKRWRRR